MCVVLACVVDAGLDFGQATLCNLDLTEKFRLQNHCHVVKIGEIIKKTIIGGERCSTVLEINSEIFICEQVQVSPLTYTKVKVTRR